MWYAEVHSDAPIEQGDFAPSCPVVVPSGEGGSRVISARIDQYDVIVISQSCDLAPEGPKVDLVLVSPVWPLSQFAESTEGFYRSSEGKEAIRRGNAPGYHMLNKCQLPSFNNEFLVVDFHNVHAVPYAFLDSLLKGQGKRLRLLPPYREHLSQAFARFFMRVGLPVDIPPFK